MPPFLCQTDFEIALLNEGIPVLEQLAANDHLHDRVLNRFNHDDPPPPYASSTESEEFEDGFPMSRWDDRLPEEATVAMDPPLTHKEIQSMSHRLSKITSPAFVYRKEAAYQRRQLEKYRPFLRNPLFWGKNSERRTKILIRHFIKRRWEKLGVWNPKWGIPVRNEQPNDNIGKWRWRWEQDDTGSPDSEARHPSREEDLVRTLLQQRQSLRRGETKDTVQRSHLEQDATTSEAESFIISRPWVTFQIECGEEQARYERALAADLLNLHRHIPLKQVIEWWKERGDWREKFEMPNGSTLVGSWKWRHESPSPEPEDLTPIDNMEDSLLDARDMDFTPSEIDALETIPPPGYISPVAPAAPAGTEPRSSLFDGPMFDDPRMPRNLFDPWTPEEMSTEDHKDTSHKAEAQLLELNKEVEEQPSEYRQNGYSAPSRNTRFHRRRQPHIEGRNAMLDQDQDQLPQIRRSARIAGMKRSAESLPSESGPNKRRKGRAISRAATLDTKPITREIQHRTRKQPAAAIPGPCEAQPRRGRGRPRKENSSGIAVKTQSRTPPRRGRGRPRKENRSGTVVTTQIRTPPRRRGKGMPTNPPVVPRRGRGKWKNE